MPTTVDLIIAALRDRVAKRGLTQLELAEHSGVSQSQISRILSGQYCRESANVQRLCDYAKQALNIQVQPSSVALGVLNSAINETWDGTDEHAEALARVIRSLSALHPPHRRKLNP
jgi:transcriptional regulator with XRE-family HTH domain